MAAQGQQVTYADLAPLTDDDPTGAGMTALGLPLIFGGLASAAALVLVYRGPVRNRVAAAVALSLAAGFVATAILQFGFGSFDGSYWLTSLAIAAGIAAISLTALGLGLLLGRLGLANWPRTVMVPVDLSTWLLIKSSVPACGNVPFSLASPSRTGALPTTLSSILFSRTSA